MMSLEERIAADLKKAMLARDIVARDTLRMLKTDLDRRQLELGGEMSDDDAIQVLKRAVKSRTESIEQYEQGGRADRAEAERREIEVIERYLPQRMDEAETRAALEALMAELGLAGKKDMGRLMKEVRDRHGARVDGKTASRLAMELLG